MFHTFHYILNTDFVSKLDYYPKRLISYLFLQSKILAIEIIADFLECVKNDANSWIFKNYWENMTKLSDWLTPILYFIRFDAYAIHFSMVFTRLCQKKVVLLFGLKNSERIIGTRWALPRIFFDSWNVERKEFSIVLLYSSN